MTDPKPTPLAPGEYSVELADPEGARRVTLRLSVGGSGPHGPAGEALVIHADGYAPRPRPASPWSRPTSTTRPTRRRSSCTSARRPSRGCASCRTAATACGRSASTATSGKAAACRRTATAAATPRTRPGAGTPSARAPSCSASGPAGKFGGYVVESRRRTEGLWEYSIPAHAPDPAMEAFDG